MNIVPLKQLDHVDQFLRTFSSEHTRSAYRKDLKDYVEFSAGMDLTTFSTLAQYRDHLIASSAPSTVVRKFSAVKSFFSFLASEGILPHNPAQNLKVPKARTLTHTEAFDDVDVSKVIDATDITGFYGSTHRIALVLLFNIGLRRSELVKLKLCSFTEYRGKKFVCIEGKGGKQRLIAMNDIVQSELNAYLIRFAEFVGSELEPHDFLLQSSPHERNQKALNPTTIYRLVKQYSRDAGVTKRVSPHSCRATVISHLLEKEVSPRSVADMVGHASISTTVGIYDKKRDALSNPAASKVSYGS